MTQQQNQPIQKKFSRIALEATCKKATGGIWAIVLCSAVNFIAEIVGLNFYFLFSASMPYYLPQFGAAYDEVLGLTSLETAAYAISVCLIVAYLVCGLFSRKKPGLLLIPLILFLFDTAFLGYVIWFTGSILSFMLDIVFHVRILVLLINGVRAGFHLATLPPEEENEPTPEDAFAPAVDFATVESTEPATVTEASAAPDSANDENTQD